MKLLERRRAVLEATARLQRERRRWQTETHTLRKLVARHRTALIVGGGAAVDSSPACCRGGRSRASAASSVPRFRSRCARRSGRCSPTICASAPPTNRRHRPHERRAGNIRGRRADADPLGDHAGYGHAAHGRACGAPSPTAQPPARCHRDRHRGLHLRDRAGGHRTDRRCDSARLDAGPARSPARALARSARDRRIARRGVHGRTGRRRLRRVGHAGASMDGAHAAGACAPGVGDARSAQAAAGGDIGRA